MICSSSSRSLEENNFSQNYVHILLAHAERQCFPVRADTECKIVKSSVQILAWLFPTNGTLFYFSNFKLFIFYWGIANQGFPSGSAVKNPPARQETRVRSRSEDPLEEGMTTHFRILTWRISMDRGAWRAMVHWVTKNWTRLQQLEKARAPHSSTLAWKIPWMEDPGRLQSMRSLRVRHS